MCRWSELSQTSWTVLSFILCKACLLYRRLNVCLWCALSETKPSGGDEKNICPSYSFLSSSDVLDDLGSSHSTVVVEWGFLWYYFPNIFFSKLLLTAHGSSCFSFHKACYLNYDGEGPDPVSYDVLHGVLDSASLHMYHQIARQLLWCREFLQRPFPYLKDRCMNNSFGTSVSFLENRKDDFLAPAVNKTAWPILYMFFEGFLNF